MYNLMNYEPINKFELNGQIFKFKVLKSRVVLYRRTSKNIWCSVRDIRKSELDQPPVYWARNTAGILSSKH